MSITTGRPRRAVPQVDYSEHDSEPDTAAATQKLLAAVKRKNLAHVQSWLNKGADPSRDGEIMFSAVSSDNADILNAVIDAGGDIHLMDGYLLKKALEYGAANSVKVLLTRGLDMNHPQFKRYLLELAIDTNNVAIIQTIAEHGADKEKLLLLVCRKAWYHGVTTLVHLGADVNKFGSDMLDITLTAIYKSYNADAMKILRVLLEAGLIVPPELRGVVEAVKIEFRMAKPSVYEAANNMRNVLRNHDVPIASVARYRHLAR